MAVAAFPQPEAIIFYDGDCHLCNRWVVFVLRHDPAAKFQFATLNSQTAHARIHDASLLNGSTVLLLTPEDLFTRSTAVLKIASELNGYRTLARLLLKIPRPLRDSVYAFIARHRHALQPSSNPACAFVPGSEGRFLD
jgi:predicted DCC family thiol-disulfide oxidoreductase YuxK